jgi:hypothetical protein
MSNEYVLHEEELVPPKGSGVPGLLKAITEIVGLPRVQEIRVKANGKIEYDFYMRKSDAVTKLNVDFEKVMPYAIVRNGVIQEIPYPNAHAATAIAELFSAAGKEHMSPIAFLGADNTGFWDWYEETTGLTPVTREELFGLPFLTDSNSVMPEMTLLLCTGFKRNALITDTVKSFKITIPKVQR